MNIELTDYREMKQKLSNKGLSEKQLGYLSIAVRAFDNHIHLIPILYHRAFQALAA